MRGFANGIIAQRPHEGLMSGLANGLIAHCANCLMASYWLISTHESSEESHEYSQGFSTSPQLRTSLARSGSSATTMMIACLSLLIVQSSMKYQEFHWVLLSRRGKRSPLFFLNDWIR